MNVFITGATGFIGKPLTRACLARRWHVTALVRNPDSPASKQVGSFGASLVKGDINDPESMIPSMKAADIVIHNAGWYEVGISRSSQKAMWRINVEGTENTVKAAHEFKVPKILYTSSIAALGPTGDEIVDESFQRREPVSNFYEKSKAEAHAVALRYRQRGAPLDIICPSNVIGPGDHSAWGCFARLYVRRLLPPFGWAPESKITFVYVDDVAEAIALAAGKKTSGETYFLGTEAITMRELVDIWGRSPGGYKPFLWLPRPLAMLSGAMAEPILRLLGQTAFFSREVVRTSFENWQFSAEKARRELGAAFLSAEEMWLKTLDGERILLKGGTA